MIVIKVWCLPLNQSEDDLNLLHKAIVKAMVSVPELCLRDENVMACLFPADRMKYGLGEEIIVEIDGLPNILQNNLPARKELAKHVGEAVSVLYPEAKVKCSVRNFDPKEAVWSSDFGLHH